MAVHFLNSIGVSSISKRVTKKEAERKNKLIRKNDFASFRRRIVNHLIQIKAYCSGVEGNYNKNVITAVKKNKVSGGYEISLIRNNIPFMWDESDWGRYLSIDGDMSDVVNKLGKIIDGMEKGQLDTLIKNHRNTLMQNKKRKEMRTE